MAGIDELISKSFTAVIKGNLDPDIEKKVKMRLFKKFGLSLNQAFSNFSKIDEILKEFLKSDTLSFEQKCLREVISLKNLGNLFLVTVKDKNLVNQIIKILGDDEYRKIIEATLSKPLLISEIIDMFQLPKTSGYRKINYLIRNGFLIGVGQKLTIKRRSVKKYTTIFQKIIFEIKKDQSVVKLEIPLKTIEQSSSIEIINPKR